MRRKHFHLIGIAFILLVFLLFIILFILVLRHYHVQVIPISINVGSYVGFNVNATALTFGTALPGSVAERALTLVAAQDQHITLFVQGIDFVSTSQTEFFMKAGGSTVISVKAFIPLNQTFGSYTGRLIILSKDI